MAAIVDDEVRVNRRLYAWRALDTVFVQSCEVCASSIAASRRNSADGRHADATAGTLLFYSYVLDRPLTPRVAFPAVVRPTNA
jgi:hypothetical protein